MSLYIFQTVQRGSAWDDEGRSPSVEGRGWRHKNGGRERTKNRGGTQTFRLGPSKMTYVYNGIRVK